MSATPPHLNHSGCGSFGCGALRHPFANSSVHFAMTVGIIAQYAERGGGNVG